jgi:hypothetical protein
MADNTTPAVSHSQQPGGSYEHQGWHGVRVNKVRRPISNEECDAAAAALRARQGLSQSASQTLAQRTGIPHEVAQFIQRLEGQVLDLQRRVQELEAADKMPHMRGVERR